QKNCGSTVKRALEALPGATRAEVSFAASRAWVWIVSPGPPLDAVEDVGFGADISADFELTVEGMMCQKNCGSTVKGALQAIGEVRKAEASFSKSLARV
ncbi:unnamed protein product, partial [Laminaria digitata]